MKRPFKTSLVAIALTLLFGEQPSLASTAQGTLVKAELVSDVKAIQPGKKFWVGIRMQLAEGWHVNWLNPGDAGLAPTVRWDLPPGFDVGEIQWPYPKRFALPELSIFGYENEVYLLCLVTPPKKLNSKTVALKANVDWLACREACIPGSAVLPLSLQVVDGEPVINKRWSDIFASTRETFPVDPSPWHFDAHLKKNTIAVVATPPKDATAKLTVLTFFPIRQGVVENAGEQVLTNQNGVYVLEITRDRMAVETPVRLQGVVVSRHGWGAGDRKALRIDVPLVK